MKTYKIFHHLTLGGTVAVLCLLTQTHSANAAESHGQLSRADYNFAVEAYRGSTEEVALGKLAQEKATDPAVKQFARRMVEDHTKASQQLEDVLAKKGATLPTASTAAAERESEHLAGLSGHEFDKAYMDQMVKDHKKDVKEFQKAAADARDPDIKAYAATTLPTLQSHLQLAESADENLKGTK